MLVVGLTGGIATGKSSVSTYLKTNGVAIVDADLLAREVVEPGTTAYRKIITTFGSSILLSNGSIDRQKLGTIIFNDQNARKKLNSIVHPAVKKAMLKAILFHWLKGEKFCFVDVPLLIETDLWKMVGKVVVIYCSEDIQLTRLLARDKTSEEACRSRIESQMPIENKRQYADKVIDNCGSLEDLKRQVDTLIDELNKQVKWTWWTSWLFPPLGLLLALWTLSSRAFRRKLRSFKQQ